MSGPRAARPFARVGLASALTVAILLGTACAGAQDSLAPANEPRATTHLGTGLDRRATAFLRQGRARTWVAAERFTLVAPLPAAACAAWEVAIEEELDALVRELGAAASFALESAPLLVSLVAREDPPAGAQRVEGRAQASGVEIAVARVEQPGASAAHAALTDAQRATLRHELLHALVQRAGWKGAAWWREGAAQYVESQRCQGGRLVDPGAPVALLVAARALPSDARSVARLLSWREDGARVLAGDERVDPVPRVLSGLLVRFLVDLERERAPAAGPGPEPLGDILRRLPQRSAAQLEALESAWQAWLADGRLPGPPRAGAGNSGAAR